MLTLAKALRTKVPGAFSVLLAQAMPAGLQV